MSTAPDAVYVIIPCMKELGMSWQEIKATPRNELLGLLAAVSNYNILHQFDGYTSEEINELAKNKPELRSQYGKYRELSELYKQRAGVERKVKSFKDVM